MKLEVLRDEGQVLTIRRSFTLPFPAQVCLRLVALALMIRIVILACGASVDDAIGEIFVLGFAAFVAFVVTWFPHGQAGRIDFNLEADAYQLDLDRGGKRAGRFSDLGKVVLVERPRGKKRRDWLVRIWTKVGAGGKGKAPKRRSAQRAALPEARIEINCGIYRSHADEIARRLCRLTGQSEPMAITDYGGSRNLGIALGR